MRKAKNQPDMVSTLKSLDTEEFLDIHFYRPIGYFWALRFEKWGVHPNYVSLASMLIGATAGVCFYFSNLWMNAAGMFLLIWANSFDSADGQLARMTGQTSPFGRMLDGFCGDVWFVCIYVAICFRMMPLWSVWIWVLAVAAGFFHSKQAAMADYYRNVHLYFLKGESGSELADSPTLRAICKDRSAADGFISKLPDYIYYKYTKGQEEWAKQFLKMRETLTRTYPGSTPERFCTAFRAKSLPLMKYTNMLSFNTRAIGLFISLFINMPWLYFIFELTALNFMLSYMVLTHEHFCAAFTKQLAGGEI
jgi:hypothetical protein